MKIVNKTVSIEWSLMQSMYTRLQNSWYRILNFPFVVCVLYTKRNGGYFITLQHRNFLMLYGEINLHFIDFIYFHYGFIYYVVSTTLANIGFRFIVNPEFRTSDLIC